MLFSKYQIPDHQNLVYILLLARAHSSLMLVILPHASCFSSYIAEQSRANKLTNVAHLPVLKSTGMYIEWRCQVVMPTWASERTSAHMPCDLWLDAYDIRATWGCDRIDHSLRKLLGELLKLSVPVRWVGGSIVARWEVTLAYSISGR